MLPNSILLFVPGVFLNSSTTILADETVIWPTTAYAGHVAVEESGERLIDKSQEIGSEAFLLFDMGRVAILFQDIPQSRFVRGRYHRDRMQVAGKGQYQRTLMELESSQLDFEGRKRLLTMKDAYANGTAAIRIDALIERRSARHAVVISEAGRKLTIDGKHQFDLDGDRNEFVVERDGQTVRILKKP